MKNRIALCLALAILALGSPALARGTPGYQGFGVAGQAGRFHASGGTWRGFSPAWIPGLVLYLAPSLSATVAVGPVTATGTSPPTVTLSGTPTAAQTTAGTPFVELDCTTLGAITVSRFTVKVNGATTASNVASAASGVSLPGSGLTAGWAVGASSTDDVYTANLVASALTDQTSSANNASQATGSKRPTLVASDAGYGGCATITFASAASQVMTLGSRLPSQPMTAVVVGESTSGATNQAFFGDGNPGAVGYFISTQWAEFAGSNLTTGGNSTRTPGVFGFYFNGTTSAVYINSGVAIATGNAGTNALTGTESIGAFGGNTDFLNGKIAALLVYPSQIAAPTLGRLLVTLGNQCGIAARQ